ncbi:MAG: hypothetical protein KatS3mg059_1293 [Thermomicrobiales bacterium]|nr:MAG: hypothetical protein KatS3mg059_1293 [Thermomicrobiales bacterium]
MCAKLAPMVVETVSVVGCKIHEPAVAELWAEPECGDPETHRGLNLLWRDLKCEDAWTTPRGPTGEYLAVTGNHCRFFPPDVALLSLEASSEGDETLCALGVGCVRASEAARHGWLPVLQCWEDESTVGCHDQCLGKEH